MAECESVLYFKIAENQSSRQKILLTNAIAKRCNFELQKVLRKN